MPASRFSHQRHKPFAEGPGASRLVLACPPLRSNVNLARIVRTASCCGVRRMIVCGSQRIDPKIARDGIRQVSIERHRTLEPVLVQWRRQGTRIVGLEQTTGSTNLYEYVFPVELLLVVGNEREGLGEDILPLVDDVVEIPVYGLPFSHNVATATAIALYEYCRQHGR